MATDVQITNNALLLIGAGQVVGTTLASATSTNRETRISQALYEQTKDWLLTAATWHFSKRKALLDSNGMPDDQEEYSDEYDTPPDFLKLIKFYPREFQYTIFEKQKIYANTSGVQLELTYAADVDEADWPTWFQNLFEFFWASKLALPVTRKAELSAEMLRQFQLQFDITVVTNAEQVPTESFGDDPFIDFR